MEFKVINSISELPNFGSSPIFADIESDGLYTDVRICQFYCPTVDELVYIVDMDKETIHNLNAYILEHHTIWFNSSYDLGTLNVAPIKTDDLFYLVKLAYPEFMEFGLKKIVNRLPYTKDLYEATRADQGKKGFVKGAYLSQQQLRYAAYDVIALARLWDDRRIQYVRDNKAYILDMQAQHYALIYQQNGLVVDEELRAKALAESEANVVKYTQLLPDGLNPNSYKQVRAYLSIDKSDHGALVAYSVSSKPLAAAAEYIILLKRAKKEVSYLISIHYDKMYTKYNVAGAISGRYTAAGGNLKNGFNAQQIPRKFQHIFMQPTETTSFVYADYSTLELRLAAAIFGDKAMHKQLVEGLDLHTEVAKQVTGKQDIESADRQRAKAVNFGFVYSMSAKTFVEYAFTSYGIKYTLKEAQVVRARYFSLYKDIARHHKYVWDNYKKGGFYVETALGRKVKPKLGTDGINIPIQGTGAETTKLAISFMVEEDAECLQYITNVVHDSIALRVPKGTEEYWATILERNMLKGWEEICKTDIFKFKDIPIEAETEIKK